MPVNEAIEQKIVSLLRRNSDGLTIKELSEQAGLHPSTASKYLVFLEAKGAIICREIGMARLFKLKKG